MYVQDLYNGEIITYTIGSRPTYSLVSKMLENALEHLPEKSPTTDGLLTRMTLSNETIRPYTWNQELLYRACLEKVTVTTTQ